MTDTITPEEFHAMQRGRRNKYGARRTVVDNIAFHSAAEAGRYGELRQLLALGVITDLHLQPRFTVFDGFMHGGDRIAPIKYVADFEYVGEFDSPVVEDVKGYRTGVYLLKRKLFLARYGDVVTFVELEA